MSSFIEPQLGSAPVSAERERRLRVVCAAATHTLHRAARSSQRRGKHRRHGTTLMEAMVSMSILGMLLTWVYDGVSQAVLGNAATAQRVAAFGLCMERLEEIRAADYDNVTGAAFPEQTVPITHLGGATRLSLTGTLTTEIVSRVDPPRKEVTSQVSWRLGDRTLCESLTGCAIDREAQTGAIGAASGSVCLHPNTSEPRAFKLVQPNGSTITEADLRSPSFPGYTGPAPHVQFQAGGPGTQTSLLLDSVPYPMPNAKKWKFEAPAMSVNLSRDVSTGKWSLGVTGSAVTITSD